MLVGGCCEVQVFYCKNYKFYLPIVKILTDSEYNNLWSIDFLNEYKDQDIGLLFQLKKNLENTINENNIADKDVKKHELNLIVTKIIMATMGCVPGYDEYFKKGLKKWFGKNSIKYVNFTSFKNLLNLVSTDNKLKKLFKNSCYIYGTKIKYPPMKLLDLYFWLYGGGSEPKEKKSKIQN